MDKETRETFLNTAKILHNLNDRIYWDGMVTLIWLAGLTIWMVFK